MSVAHHLMFPKAAVVATDSMAYKFASRIGFPLAYLMESTSESAVVPSNKSAMVSSNQASVVSSNKSNMVYNHRVSSTKSSTKAAFVSFEPAGLSQRDCHGRHQDDEHNAIHGGWR